MNEQSTPKPAPQIEYKKAEEYSEDYANNVFFQSSNWDVKMLFGELDQSLGPNTIVQHTGITVPWSQLKLMIYFMNVSLLLHEAQFGKVVVPPSLVPEVPKQMPKHMRDAGTPEAAWQQLRHLYEQFIAANPQAVPNK